MLRQPETDYLDFEDLGPLEWFAENAPADIAPRLDPSFRGFPVARPQVAPMLTCAAGRTTSVNGFVFGAIVTLGTKPATRPH